MRKTFLLGFCVVSISCFSQTTFKKDLFYAELAGNGLVLSANYEKQILTKPGLGLHIGIGLGGDLPMIPTGVVYLFPLKKSNSFIEAGAGVTLAEENLLDDNLFIISTAYRPVYIPSIGLRHHTHYGLMWKLIYSPAFSKSKTVPLFGGFSLGWRI
jgi:hypothetical protein